MSIFAVYSYSKALEEGVTKRTGGINARNIKEVRSKGMACLSFIRNEKLNDSKFKLTYRCLTYSVWQNHAVYLKKMDSDQ